MTKYSRQREAIVRFLSSQTDHPTADMIYRKVREEYPNISLGTVYRNLDQLCSQGRALRLSGVGTPDRYDPNPALHYHFCCKVCGAIRDLPVPPLDELNEWATRYAGGTVETHALCFYGICGCCLNTEQEEKGKFTRRMA